MRYCRIIIVGCGPAGIACAIQLKRMGLHPLVIEKDRPGGMLFNANKIENYPGFPGGLSGQDLANRFIEQFHSFNIENTRDEITNINYNDEKFKLTGKEGAYVCHILIAATGTTPVIPDNCPEELISKGLIHFDISILRQMEGKTIGIIGAGDAAFDYGLSLAEKENNILILNRGDQVKALKTLTEKVFINNRIKYLDNITVERLETNAGGGLSAICLSASSNKNYSLDYLIFATGRKPADGFFHESLRGDMHGLLSEHRLSLIGDIINGPYRQVSVAVGDGVKIAMEIFRNESNQ